LVEISAEHDKFGYLNPSWEKLGVTYSLVINGSLESPWSTFSLH